MKSNKGKVASAAFIIVGVAVCTGAVASPASATQHLTGQYCGTPGNYGQYSAYSDSSTDKAGTAHYTGPLCGAYYVNSHYVVGTTGAAYWMGYTFSATSVTQSPGYNVDKALHKTDQSSPITTN